VLPVLRHASGLSQLASASSPAKALALLVTAVVVGLVLSALQTPLYRVLEGYRGLPPGLRQRRTSHHIQRKHLLDQRLKLARLSLREALGSQRVGDAAALAELRSEPALRGVPEMSGNVTPVALSMLAERHRRYPVDDGQVLPTLLGNAIRRFEEYGYDRYRLDAVTMWNPLVGVAPDELRKRVDAGRVGVNFFVCLIYGQLILAVSGVIALAAVPDHPVGPALAIALPVVLIPLSYRLAVEATDEWAAAFRGLVDLGRKPLAEALGLAMPTTLEQEREMWKLASRMSRRPYSPSDEALDQFRANGGYKD
jgi:hypothetical protein